MKLAGLQGLNPVAALAGYGLLWVLPEAKLGWAHGSLTAQLEGFSSLDEVLLRLGEHMRGRSQAPELKLRAEVKGLTEEDYVKALETFPPEWVACLWAETPEGIRPTDLCLTAGQQKFLGMARELAEALDPAQVGEARVRAAFEEALVGPWTYQDECHSWGWDPVAERNAATTKVDPGKTQPKGVAGAYWLAFEALPLLPMLGGRTVGMHADGRAWSWLLSHRPLDRAATRTLLWTASTLDEAELRALDVERWSSRIARSGRYGWLQPAARTRSERAFPGGFALNRGTVFERKGHG
ncbi:MAG: hypothetical protein WA970_20130 [Gammaproteobacteria bacterium]